MKYGKSLKNTAHELGITVAEVKKYLTHARLSDKVKKCRVQILLGYLNRFSQEP